MTDDLVELHQLCARYMLLCSQFLEDRWLEVFTPDGWRIRRRSTTFMRKHGGFDSGVQHDPLAESAEGAAQ